MLKKLGKVKKLDANRDEIFLFLKEKRKIEIRFWNRGIFAIEKEINKMMATDMKKIIYSFGDVLVLLKDGNICFWDSHENARNFDIENQIKGDAKDIFTNYHSFVILLQDDTIIVTGPANQGGILPIHLEKIKMKSILNVEKGWAVVTKNGDLYYWKYGESQGKEVATEDKIKIMVPFQRTFLFLSTYGEVKCFMNGYCGPYKISEALHTNVQILLSNKYAYAVLFKNGTLLTQGEENFGGEHSIENTFSNPVINIFATGYGFLVTREDNSIIEIVGRIVHFHFYNMTDHLQKKGF